jgi:hypothetical protein
MLTRLALTLLALVALAGFGVQHTRTQVLQARVAALAAEAALLNELSHENARLRKQAPTVETLDNLRREHAALEAQRAELRERSERLEKKTAVRAAPAAPGATQPLMAKAAPPAAWKFEGNATSRSALNSVIWAAVGGDTVALTKLITLDENGRAAVQEVFDRLPAETRAEFGSPEGIVATFAAARMPLNVESVVVENETVRDGVTTLQLQISRGETNQKNVAMRARQTPEGWKIVVPDALVERYMLTLTAGR